MKTHKKDNSLRNKRKRGGEGKWRERQITVLNTPWRIGTLKYLEVKIEEWPSRSKLGQAGPSGAKQGQMVPYSAKWCQTGSNGAKWGQTGPKMAKKCLIGPNLAKRANGAKRGQMGSFGADFLHAHIFL